MEKANPNPPAKRMSIKEIKSQLDSLTAKLKEFENNGSHCSVHGCKFVSDGLRLSQEVELLQKENTALRKENETLRHRWGGTTRDAIG